MIFCFFANVSRPTKFLGFRLVIKRFDCFFLTLVSDKILVQYKPGLFLRSIINKKNIILK